MNSDLNTNLSVAEVASIKRWQEEFYKGIFNPTDEYIQQACRNIDATEVLSAEDRLGIYRHSILGGISSALMGIYPVCTRLVGDTFFTHMVAGYLRKYPSESADMGDYGEFLADYLETFLVKINQHQGLKYLPDVARLEWLWHQAFNAAELSIELPAELSNGLGDEAIIPLSELVRIPVEQQGRIVFKLQPSLGLLSSIYPIHDIWQANQVESDQAEWDQKESDKRESDDSNTIELKEEHREFAIWRSPDFAMRIETLSIAGELAFMKDIQQGHSFAGIAAKEYSSSVEVLLPHVLQSGLVIGFTLA
ncbi:MAG: hypothetical protein ACI910_001889 [Oleispira sp.]|jgi:hypothetical protein